MSAKQPVVEHGIVAGNVYDKYNTTNPVARRLMRRFLNAVTDLVELSEAREVHEVGCGEGNLSLHLSGLGLTVRGSDFSSRVIETARRQTARQSAKQAGLAEQLEFKVASIHDLEPAADAAPLVVCCEVLEHLERPAEALAILATLAQPYLLLSAPREPLWRILNLTRGAYIRDLGNTPGHLNHWSKRAFLRMLREHVEIVAVRSPLPWTIALCRASHGTTHSVAPAY